MRIKIILCVLLLSVFVFVELFAQEMPLVYEVENTGADYPIPYFPAFGELPGIKALPDPFVWSDGRGRISNFSDWRYRRAEIAAEIEHYEIGEKPVRPDSITASYAGETLTVHVTVNGNTLTLTSAVTLPAGEGPFPAVIGMGSPTGSIPSYIFSSRDIAQIPFNFGQVMAHTQTRGSEPINALYPELTYMGAYSAWSWGVSRLIDGLELVSEDLNIDMKRLAVTGCSFAGKMALFAGAFDERIALTISQESGGGGYTTWRVSETLGTVETLGKTSHAWFIEDLFQFSNAVPKLPYDHHELMAMVAPRALLVTGNPDYEWLADESGHVGSKAAKEVWNALGVSDRFGYSIVAGHLHCQVPASQIPEIEAFVEKFLLGNDSANTNVSTSPYNSNLSPWINWTAPTLSNDSSFFAWTCLVYPENLRSRLETNITLKWNKAKDAEKYLLQLSTDPTFKNIFESDSTTDTVKTITNLSEGKRYYWRVQVKNAAGLSGPWSNQWNFITFIPAPASSPQLVSATQIPIRTDYIKFTWKQVEKADQYFVQLTTDENFTRIINSAFTSDTVINLNRTQEGLKFYWRVQAKNITGDGPWSEAADFTIIMPPTGLELENTASNEVTLTWKDNSAVEDGYIIERKQSPDTFFTVRDSLKDGGTEYVDSQIETKDYTFRVRAYKDSAVSVYSNEVSILLSGIEDEYPLPTEYSISQNYPNPFNPSTQINYAIPHHSYITLEVFNLLGQKVISLYEGVRQPGNYTVTFNGSGLTSGVYIYRMQSEDFVRMKKLILLK